MDNKRFDELTRAIGAGTSRRRVLKGLAASVGGGLAALVNRRVPGILAAQADPCTSDDDCAEGEVCNTGQGQCTLSCTTNDECAEGFVCEPSFGGCLPGECASDADCDVENGFVCGSQMLRQCGCVSGYRPCNEDLCCPPDSSCPADGGTTCIVACTDDADCGDGEVCDEGSCVSEAECTSDDDCAEGDVCTDGACMTTTTPECTEDTNCPGAEVCAEGTCTEPDNGGGDDDGGDDDGGDDTGGDDTGGDDTGVTLPTTGVGGSQRGDTSWLGAAAIGGVAAILAGEKLRRRTTPTQAE